jgi:hypothetical protein
MRKVLWSTLVVVLLASVGWWLPAETINGARTILGAVDFSGAATTKPAKTGTAPPGTCAVGETFIDTDAAAASQFLVCTAINVWTAQGGGGGGNTITQGTRAALPGAGTTTGDMYICTNSPYTFIWDGAAWDAFVYGIQVTEPLLANLTQTAITGAPTISATRGGILITSAGAQSVDYQITAPAFAAPYSVVMVALVTIISDSTGTEVELVNALDSNDFDRISWVNIATQGWRLGYAKTVAGAKTDLDIGNSSYLLRGGSRLFVYRVWDDGVTNKGGDVGDGFGGWITLHSRGRAVDFTPTKGGFRVDTTTGTATVKVWILGLTEFNSIP